MRKDMAKVIVTRARILEDAVREGRSLSDENQPKSIGLRRHARERGGFKILNENLAPLRRYLEAQVGRPWDKVYSEITANLRVSNTVQQHVRDHLADFVNLHRVPGRWPAGLAGLPWHQPLYVDARGHLRRTGDMPEVRKAQRVRRAKLRNEKKRAPTAQ